MIFLAFIAFVESVHDSDIDDEFTDDQKVIFFNNLVVKHDKSIKNDLRDHDILEAHKSKIDVIKEERTNLLEKKNGFLEFEHHSLLEKNNVFT